jgi:hypothetical protein
MDKNTVILSLLGCELVEIYMMPLCYVDIDLNLIALVSLLFDGG